MGKKRYYLIDENGKELGVFRGHRPSQAAMKVATKVLENPGEIAEIRLLNKRDKRIYIYEVTIEKVKMKVPWKAEITEVKKGKIVRRKAIERLS